MSKNVDATVGYDSVDLTLIRSFPNLELVVGNLTLTAYNAKLSNDGFAAKKQILADSGLAMNRDIARAMTEVTGQPYRPLRAGSVGGLGSMIRLTQLVAPERGSVFPAWQGMQYTRDMFGGEGRLAPL